MTSFQQLCVWCGITTTSERRVCQGCIAVENRAKEIPGDDLALSGGSWVLDPATRVQRWERTW